MFHHRVPRKEAPAGEARRARGNIEGNYRKNLEGNFLRNIERNCRSGCERKGGGTSGRGPFHRLFFRTPSDILAGYFLRSSPRDFCGNSPRYFRGGAPQPQRRSISRRGTAAAARYGGEQPRGGGVPRIMSIVVARKNLLCHLHIPKAMTTVAKHMRTTAIIIAR